MLPFKVFDRDNKITWVIINFHPSQDGGEYLAAREDDSNHDGEIHLIKSADMKKFRMVGFLEEQE